MHSLRILSPPADSLKESPDDKYATRTTKTKKEQRDDKIASDMASTNFGSSSGIPTPARKIRRPISIRRPKLIGKSVEGAALQAVAASRARASSNHFKNVASGSAQSKRPPRDVASARDPRKASSRTPSRRVDASLKDAPRSSQLSRRQSDQTKWDETLVRVTRDFCQVSTLINGFTHQRSSLQRTALKLLASTWWPCKQAQDIPQSVGEFIVSKTPVAWSDARLLPPLPQKMQEVFTASFARWIAAWTPGLELLPISSKQSSVKGHSDTVLLSSEIKNVRGCKCLAVVMISRKHAKNHRIGKPIVRCEGWVLNLPRRAKSERRRIFDLNSTSMQVQEKDSAGMDKLASDLHVSIACFVLFLVCCRDENCVDTPSLFFPQGSLALESLLFDFSASIVERTMRTFDEKVDYNELIPILQRLIARYPLERQKRLVVCN